MSLPSSCPTCWPAADVSRLVKHAEGRLAATAGEPRALVGSLSLRLDRLAAQHYPLLVARAGLAFGSLVTRHVLYPDSSPRPVLVSPDLGPGGELTDTGTLLGHLHLLTLDSPVPALASSTVLAAGRAPTAR